MSDEETLSALPANYWCVAILSAMFMATTTLVAVLGLETINRVAFWPNVGFLVAICILLGLVRGGVLSTVLVFGSDYLVGALNPRIAPPPHMIAGNVVALIVILGVTALLRWRLGRRPDFTRWGTLVRFALITTAAFVTLGALTVALQRGHDGSVEVQFVSVFQHASGILMIVPPALLLGIGRERAPPTGKVWEVASLFVGLGVCTALLFTQGALSSLFIIFPVVIALCFRLRAQAVAAAAALVGALAFTLTVFGFGPLFSAGAQGHLMLQFFILAVVYTALPVSGALEAMREAQAAASRSAAAKSDFLATMSHELRTPLNSISGFSQVLAEDETLSPTARRQVTVIGDATQSLLTVVNDILDFSKIEAGKIELVERPFALDSWACGCLEIVRQSAESKGLSLQCQIDPEADCWFSGDDLRLRQVLLNLLNNAIKFTKAGAVTLRIEVLSSEPEQATVKISVADTGPGIPDEAQSRLFQRFSQVDGSIARNFGGTGLGLAISKKLVELMGGTIGVESRLGEGSTFWFQTTFERAESGAATLEVSNDAPLSARVLVVDDMVVNREIVRLMLVPIGCDVAEAEDAETAIQLLKSEAFDLVLLDLQMPGTDGLTAAKIIRRLPGPMSRVPIVAMTANVMQAQVRQCLEAGMNGHLGKPFNKTDLIAAVRNSAGHREPGSVVSSSTPLPQFDGLALFDPGPLLAMGAHPGTAVRRSLLCSLGDLLGSAFDTADIQEGREALAGESHALISAAGSLGFSALSAAARALERGCKEQAADCDTRLTVARAAAAAARRELERLLREEEAEEERQTAA